MTDYCPLPIDMPESKESEKALEDLLRRLTNLVSILGGSKDQIGYIVQRLAQDLIEPSPQEPEAKEKEPIDYLQRYLVQLNRLDRIIYDMNIGIDVLNRVI